MTTRDGGGHYCEWPNPYIQMLSDVLWLWGYDRIVEYKKRKWPQVIMLSRRASGQGGSGSE